jgi:hypothetical protein
MKHAFCCALFLGMSLLVSSVRAEDKAAEAPAQSTLPAADADGWINLWNGKDLTGWHGDTEIWRVEKDYISGKKEKQGWNSFLVFNYPFKNFTLEFKFILIDKKGNSGVQYRSWVKNWQKFVVAGYQADIGNGYWGSLYDEANRGKLLFTSPKELAETIKTDDWNSLTVEANGTKLKHTLNGKPAGEFDDTDEAKRKMEGIIALQYHAPGAFEIRFKDIRIKLLPDTK